MSGLKEQGLFLVYSLCQWFSTRGNSSPTLNTFKYFGLFPWERGCHWQVVTEEVLLNIHRRTLLLKGELSIPNGKSAEVRKPYFTCTFQVTLDLLTVSLIPGHRPMEPRVGHCWEHSKSPIMKEREDGEPCPNPQRLCLKVSNII